MAKSPTHVFVLPVKGRETEIESLKQAIDEAGCELICQQVTVKEYEKCIADADVLVVLICPQTMNDPAVNKLIELASRLGKRVVGVWAPDLKDATLPPAIHTHGTAVIVLDASAIRRSICGDESNWSTPEGKPRPAPKTPRHKGK